MQKYEHAFGKNDIRGIYTKDITEELSKLFIYWKIITTSIS